MTAGTQPIADHPRRTHDDFLVLRTRHLAFRTDRKRPGVDEMVGRDTVARDDRHRFDSNRSGKLGARLAGVEWAAVYRSPLGRTGETAALVAPGFDARISPGLIEINYGGWEGLSPAQARERDKRTRPAV